mmetsp:Transcript_124542/g.248443  ORF Transcript_124542/g.248443 Transcript_124542/m.248443 type:complete len:423 (+) Transcript_124542:129-1397(+)
MLGTVGNRLVFPAPHASYTAQSYKRHLCWIPWNAVISPHRMNDANGGSGIPCLWFPAPKAATIILFFHANAEDLGMSFAVLKHMRDQFKVNILAVEYPGYGLLRAALPSEDSIYEVALTVLRYLVDEMNVRYSHIVLFGRSLGSGPAVYLAAQYPVGGLILVSAFCSIRAAIQSIVGRAFALTFRERFPNIKIIGNVSCATLLIHGSCDGLIPVDHSLRLFRRCRARKLLITPPKMEHNSNLFSDASFLAVPAIHFFGFPGYHTISPPRLPASLFSMPPCRVATQFPEARSLKPWLCDCLGANESKRMDISFCRQEPSVDEVIDCHDQQQESRSGEGGQEEGAALLETGSDARCAEQHTSLCTGATKTDEDKRGASLQHSDEPLSLVNQSVTQVGGPGQQSFSCDHDDVDDLTVGIFGTSGI